MNFLSRAIYKARARSIFYRSGEFAQSLFANGITGLSFDTSDGPIVVPTNSGSIVESFLRGNYFGADTIGQFLKHSSPARRLLNIGANVGTSARLLSESNQYDQIDCFEPDSDNFSFLKINTAQFQEILINQVALGAGHGELQLNLNVKSVGRHSFKRAFGGPSITVQVRRIDEFVGADEKYDIYMDVEGWEIEALKGAGATLKNCGSCCLEWNGNMHSPAQKESALEILVEAGFARIVDIRNSKADVDILELVKIDLQTDIVVLRNGAT